MEDLESHSRILEAYGRYELIDIGESSVPIHSPEINLLFFRNLSPYLSRANGTGTKELMSDRDGRLTDAEVDRLTQCNSDESEERSSPADTKRFIHLYDEQRKRKSCKVSQKST